MSERDRRDDRPTHIVLFRDTGAGAEATVAAALEALALPADGTRAVYPDLGVAVVTADAAQVARLNARADVEAVFVNEERRLPTPVDGGDPDAGGGGGTADGLAAAGDPAIAYLTGMRDGIDAALAALGGDRTAARIAPAGRRGLRFRDSEAMTWGLQAIGAGGTALSGAGIRVAVLDTGLDLQHLDFADRIAAVNTRSFVAGEPVQDGHGHGTHCCGTVNGPALSSGGRRYGVAPEAELLVGKVLSNQGRGFDDQILAGIEWAAVAGARIISMSLGSPRTAAAAFSPLYERIAERLFEQRPGVLLIAAAGNDSRRPWSTRPVGNPAACPSIMGIAAVDADLAVARFSNRQMDGIGRLDLAAPGVGVYSSVPGGFAVFDGTSMATPHVAGVAALLMQQEPAATAREIWERLIDRAQALGDPNDVGAGLVRVPQAAAAALAA